MELELTVDAEAVSELGRLKSLTSCRIGRPRTQSVKIVWHDSPEHALLADGLALAEQRGAWRLERMVPRQDTWLPAQPAPLISDTPDLTTLPSPLAPLAAFEGRRTGTVHQIADASVALTVEKGVLRTVTAEQPIARILLTGEAVPIRTAALMIADAVAVAVPRASMPAEAVALAIGRLPPPRHHGAPVLPDGPIGVTDALAHILGHLTDVIVANAPLAVGLDETGVDAVHQMRVAVRRARSAMSIFQPAVQADTLDAVNASLRTLGHQLGPSRDWDVFVQETLPALQRELPDDARMQRLAAAATRRRREHRTTLIAYLNSAEFRRLGIELAWFVASGTLQAVKQDDADVPEPSNGAEVPGPLVTFSAQVLHHRWKKLVSAGKQMTELDVPGLHEVRLRAKRARYAAEMFATLYHGKSAHRFIRRLSELQQRLGVLNDGAVATHLLDELGGGGGRHAYAVGLVVGFMAARIGRIRPDIITAFEKFRRQPAYWT